MATDRRLGRTFEQFRVGGCGSPVCSNDRCRADRSARTAAVAGAPTLTFVARRQTRSSPIRPARGSRSSPPGDSAPAGESPPYPLPFAPAGPPALSNRARVPRSDTCVRLSDISTHAYFKWTFPYFSMLIVSFSNNYSFLIREWVLLPRVCTKARCLHRYLSLRLFTMMHRFNENFWEENAKHPFWNPCFSLCSVLRSEQSIGWGGSYVQTVVLCEISSSARPFQVLWSVLGIIDGRELRFRAHRPQQWPRTDGEPIASFFRKKVHTTPPHWN